MEINSKQILVIIGVIAIIIGGVYYFMSPYQKCRRTVDKKIEEIRNKLATETDVNTRVELESEQEGLFNQREFCGVVLTDQSKEKRIKSYVCDDNGMNCQYVDISNLDNKPIKPTQFE
jgi:hypothetical protein